LPAAFFLESCAWLWYSWKIKNFADKFETIK